MQQEDRAPRAVLDEMHAVSLTEREPSQTWKPRPSLTGDTTTTGVITRLIERSLLCKRSTEKISESGLGQSDPGSSQESGDAQRMVNCRFARPARAERSALLSDDESAIASSRRPEKAPAGSSKASAPTSSSSSHTGTSTP